MFDDSTIDCHIAIIVQMSCKSCDLTYIRLQLCQLGYNLLQSSLNLKDCTILY